jgi:hypothetical protein
MITTSPEEGQDAKRLYRFVIDMVPACPVEKL